MNDLDCKESRCRLCGNEPLRSIFDFQPNPYGDLFHSNREIALSSQKFPITISRCDSCKLLQLRHETNLDSQYLEYLYLTGVTNNLSKYYGEVANRYINELNLKLTSHILDLGSNDGAFLQPFMDAGYPVLGVDPSRPAADYANKKGIETLNEYFSEETVSRIKERNLEIALISVNYTLANVPNVSRFFNNINALVSSDTYVSIITGYHPEQFMVNMFDYIGHDHLTYFTVGNIEKVAHDFNLEIVDVEKIEHKGGSVRILLRRSPVIPKSSKFQLLQREKWLNVDSDASVLEMLGRVETSKHELKEALRQNSNGIIGGIGASISTSYFIVHYQIKDDISLLFDDDARKIGRFSPGSGIEVRALRNLVLEEVDNVVMLAWQHTDKLLNRLSEIGFHGRVLIPLPRFHIMEL